MISQNIQSSSEEKGECSKFAWQQARCSEILLESYVMHILYQGNKCVSVRVLLCVCVGVFEFFVSMLVKVWNIEGGKEREESLFSALGLVVVVELFMRLCDTTLAALGHRGNNKRVLNSGARAGNDCFITRFGQLTARWRCCGGNSWAF